jgi:hypothetical protein
VRLARVIAGVVLSGLVGAAPAAAEVPHEKRWQRAAEIARFPATPAPGDLAGFVLGQGQNGLKPIDGYYDAFEPGDRDCRRLKDRVEHRFTTGHFQHGFDAAYGASMVVQYQGLDERRKCWPQRTSDPSSVRFVRHVTVLGKRMKLRWDPAADNGTYYYIAGRLRGHRFYLQISYGDEAGKPGEAEIVRIARGMRWVRR